MPASCSRKRSGRSLSRETRQAITRAESRPQALALLCSWRRSSSGDDHDPACSDPPRAAAGLRHAVRLGLSAQARACRGSRSAPARHRAACSGALDGLAAVAPVGDPDWIGCAATRRSPSPARPGLPLDPSSRSIRRCPRTLHRLYKAGAATIVHATATPYRERSHFDGQDVLESGLGRPGAADTGWLNRALVSAPPAGRAGGRGCLAVGPIAPLVVRGPAPVLSWTPRRLPPASDDTLCGCSTSLSPYRSRARARARGARGACHYRACRRHGWRATAGGRRRAGAGLFRGIRRHGGEISRAARRAAHRRARLRRLGHPCRRRRA